MDNTARLRECLSDFRQKNEEKAIESKQAGIRMLRSVGFEVDDDGLAPMEEGWSLLVHNKRKVTLSLTRKHTIPPSYRDCPTCQMNRDSERGRVSLYDIDLEGVVDVRLAIGFAAQKVLADSEGMTVLDDYQSAMFYSYYHSAHTKNEAMEKKLAETGLFSKLKGDPFVKRLLGLG